MNPRLVRMFLVVGIVAVAAIPASANHGGNAVVSSGCCGANAGCAPAMQTVTSYVCVPETFTTTRTVYKRVCKTVPCTEYKCICEPITKTREVTHMVRKPVVKTITKTVYDRVPVTETRTVMKSHWVNQTVTEMRSKRVDRGHWECVEVNAPFQTLCARIHYACTKDPCCNPCPPCPSTRTVKRWCSNWVTECYPVTCCKKVCVQEPHTCCYTTYKCVPRQVECQVTCYVCEPCTKIETYTCNVMKKVAFETTRQVWECVPVQEQVTCTRYVRKAVCTQVPVSNCCETTCCSSGRSFRLFGGLRDRFAGGCCSSGCSVETSCGGCSTGCSTGCCGH